MSGTCFGAALLVGTHPLLFLCQQDSPSLDFYLDSMFLSQNRPQRQ